MNDKEERFGDGSCSRKFHIIQPNRDLQSNFSVDLAKNLEEYLLKICSGEITEDDESYHSVNFAEAALLIQNSIQVYSRKVEYLYSLVLHALEFLSQKSHDQLEQTSVQPDRSDSTIGGEDIETFLGLDDVPLESNTFFDDGPSKDDILNHFVKPPVNLLVLEGDCFNTTGDAGELESYLLATSSLYRDFLLLDPRDAGEIDDFLNGNNAGEHSMAYRGSSTRSKTRRSFVQSPTRRSEVTVQKLNLQKSYDDSLKQSPEIVPDFGLNDNNVQSQLHAKRSHSRNDNYNEEPVDGGFPEIGDESEDDPWKPLNPHQPGNLKVKPFKNGKVCGRRGKSSIKSSTISRQFPVAGLDDTVDSEFAEVEARLHACEKLRASDSPSLYEKLRQSLVLGGHEGDSFVGVEDENEATRCGNHDFEFDQADIDLQDDILMNMEEPLQDEKQTAVDLNYSSNESFGEEEPNSQVSLEDLCRCHLDALLAKIAETEKQTDLAARVSTWKQRIERNLEEQESRPPFDIHAYGERVLEKLSLESDSEHCMSFMDVVDGKKKHDVARTFSAVLQLVNNGDVDLDRGETSDRNSVCYAAVNPFYVRLLRHDKMQEDMPPRSSKRRIKSPLFKTQRKKPVGRKLGAVSSSSLDFTSPGKSSHPNINVSVNIGKTSMIRRTPEGKRRRQSRLIETS